jgi:hypothetical protein
LDLLKHDLINDISSEGHPLCSVNYVWLTAQFTLLFSRIEDALKSLRNPVWVRAYEEDPLLALETRASLTMLALRVSAGFPTPQHKSGGQKTPANSERNSKA